MTKLRSQVAVLAFVTAGIFPSLTVASPNDGTVGGRYPAGSRQMDFGQDGSSVGVERGNRSAGIPNEHTYRPIVEKGWIDPRSTKDPSNAPERLMNDITAALANPRYRAYRFGAPNAGFEIDARVEGGRDGSSQVIFMLRQDVRSEDDFKRLQQTADPVTRRPYISQNAQWQGEGRYPVGAFVVGKNARGADVAAQALNPYDYVDDPARFAMPDPRNGKAPTAVVQLFGLPKDQDGVAHGQVRADFQGDFPQVQGRSGLSNVFSGLFGGGQQRQPQQQQQYPQQQYPGQPQQQRPGYCDGPSALDGAVGGNGRGGVQINLGKVISNMTTPKRPGCE